MAIALLMALALSGGEPASTATADQSAAPSVSAEAPAAEKVHTREEMEDAIPEGAPKEDYEFVAWCHGALAGQIELDPLVEKDMDAIEGKAKAAKRREDDVAIAKEHKQYLALYERALSAAEKASPVAIHQQGVDAELLGYKIWGPTRNKAPIWRMVDWGNWEVPPRCEKAAKRLYDRASLFGEALNTETASAAPPPASGSTPDAAKLISGAAAGANAPKDPATPAAAEPMAAKTPADAAPAAADTPDPGKGAPPSGADAKSGDDAMRGPK